MMSTYLVLALAVCSCTAVPQFLNSPRDNVKQMTVEHRPLLKLRHTTRTIAQSVRSTSLALRQFREKLEQSQPGAIPEVAASLGLTTLVEAVVAAGLKDVLESEGPFTVFGPTNEAFFRLPEWVKRELRNTTILAEVLKYHVLPGKVESKSLSNELTVNTVEGSPLRINIYTVEETQVATAQCRPIDLRRVDEEASNGVIHVLHGVMIPPAGNLVVLLSHIEAFSILVQAVQAAGLVDLLSGPGPFTVFAPTDRAFAQLPEGELQKLLDNPTLLVKVLEYHVVSGTFCSIGLTSGNVETVEGQDVRVTVTPDGVVVNESNVIAADASVTNGVVHAIDAVLLPPDYKLLA